MNIHIFFSFSAHFWNVGSHNVMRIYAQHCTVLHATVKIQKYSTDSRPRTSYSSKFHRHRHRHSTPKTTHRTLDHQTRKEIESKYISLKKKGTRLQYIFMCPPPNRH